VIRRHSANVTDSAWGTHRHAYAAGSFRAAFVLVHLDSERESAEGSAIRLDSHLAILLGLALVRVVFATRGAAVDLARPAVLVDSPTSTHPNRRVSAV
jgi:hypothetical protein